jgi:gas vesicle protein
LRKALFGVLIGALVFSAVAFAASQSNTVKYRSTVKYSGKATKKKPKNVKYTGILHIGTTNGAQPNTAPLTEVFFAKQLKNNAAKFKACPPKDIDGKATISKRCKKAVIGGGTAHALVGKAGSTASFPQDLKVVALNGPKGKAILLALTGGALGGSYRVINGKVTYLKGKFGYKVGFRVPHELQEPAPGSQIALTDFNVKINTSKTVKIKHKKASYLQMTGCPKSKKLPVRATVHFNDDNNQATSNTVTDNATMGCH